MGETLHEQMYDQLDSRSEQHIEILVARRLISKYMEVGEYEKALKQSELVIKRLWAGLYGLWDDAYCFFNVSPAPICGTTMCTTIAIYRICLDAMSIQPLLR